MYIAKTVIQSHSYDESCLRLENRSSGVASPFEALLLYNLEAVFLVVGPSSISLAITLIEFVLVLPLFDRNLRMQLTKNDPHSIATAPHKDSSITALLQCMSVILLWLQDAHHSNTLVLHDAPVVSPCDLISPCSRTVGVVFTVPPIAVWISILKSS
jgi:hypothetical protein